MAVKRKDYVLRGGDVIDRLEFHDGNYGAPGKKRKKKKKPTKEDMQKVNSLNKARKARQKMLEYMSMDDISVINALTAAEDVLIPIEVDDNTMEGMKELLEQIEEVREEVNPDLKTVKCFITKYQKRNEAHRQGAEIVKKWYPTMETMIRFSVVVAKSTFVRTPVTLYSPRSAAAEDYEKLVTEYLNMIGGNENGEI